MHRKKIEPFYCGLDGCYLPPNKEIHEDGSKMYVRLPQIAAGGKETLQEIAYLLGMALGDLDQVEKDLEAQEAETKKLEALIAGSLGLDPTVKQGLLKELKAIEAAEEKSKQSLQSIRGTILNLSQSSLTLGDVQVFLKDLSSEMEKIDAQKKEIDAILKTIEKVFVLTAHMPQSQKDAIQQLEKSGDQLDEHRELALKEALKSLKDGMDHLCALLDHHQLLIQNQANNSHKPFKSSNLNRKLS